ncbi:hypothetical protein GOC83_08195 [Haloarcula rubripromontorii]|uniref:Uncharacterized protein n=1 Tax=Haloarcula rubripromontorii TaxID=1705562 RepID=A0A847U0U0_9EURY|nr:hypothetical protein [Haloarcula rubripromontorii]NLV06107.1 hypothetical protein [Haloarcula rubripromontorii]
MLTGIEEQAEDSEPRNSTISQVLFGTKYSDLESDEEVPEWLSELREDQFETLDEITLNEVQLHRGRCEGYLKRVVDEEMNAEDNPAHILDHPNLPELCENNALKQELIATYIHYNSDAPGSIGLNAVFSQMQQAIRAHDQNGEAELEGIVEWIYQQRDINRNCRNEVILCIGIYALANGRNVTFD